MKRITLTLIAILAVILVTVAPGASQSDQAANVEGYQETGNVAQGTPEALKIEWIIAQPADSGEIEVAGDCCTTLEKCQEALTAALIDPPDIPLGGLLKSFAWYRALPAWSQVLISGTATAAILAGSIYAGIESEK